MQTNSRLFLDCSAIVIESQIGMREIAKKALSSRLWFADSTKRATRHPSSSRATHSSGRTSTGSTTTFLGDKTYILYLFIIKVNQCIGSVLISIQIRVPIQHFRSIRIRFRMRIQVFSWQKREKKNFCAKTFDFLVTHCYIDLDKGLPGSNENH